MDKTGSSDASLDTDRQIATARGKDVEVLTPLDNQPPQLQNAIPSVELSSPDRIPDGGYDAWLQVLGSWVILVDTWGLINCYGVFQSYYETNLLSSRSSSDISWIGSVQGALLMIVGVVSGPLYDAGYFRELLRVGIFLIVLGQFMTSLCTAYWQVLLSQGVCTGIGMGLSFLPSTAILSQYFLTKRALVLGLSSTGSPLAGIIFPILFSRLEPTIGFGWATRVIAFVLLGISIIPLVFMHTRIPASGRMRSLFDRTALTDGPFVVFAAGTFLSFLTLYVPFFYVKVFADAYSFSEPSFTPYLVTLLSVGSVFGRIIPNAAADHLGSLNMLALCTFASAILALGWLGIHNLGGLVVFSLLSGAFSGGVVSLTPSVIVSLSSDLGRVGARMGMSFLLSGVAILIGPPIAGAVLGNFTDSEWLGTIGYGAAGLLAATALISVSRLILYKQSGRMKA